MKKRPSLIIAPNALAHLSKEERQQFIRFLNRDDIIEALLDAAAKLKPGLHDIVAVDVPREMIALQRKAPRTKGVKK